MQLSKNRARFLEVVISETAFNPQLESRQLKREGRVISSKWKQNKKSILSIYHTPERYLAFS